MLCGVLIVLGTNVLEDFDSILNKLNLLNIDMSDPVLCVSAESLSFFIFSCSFFWFCWIAFFSGSIKLPFSKNVMTCVFLGRASRHELQGTHKCFRKVKKPVALSPPDCVSGTWGVCHGSIFCYVFNETLILKCSTTHDILVFFR